MNALVFTFYLPPLDPYLEFLFQVDPETYNKLWQEIQSLFKRLTSDPQYYWMVGRLLDYLTKHPKRHLMQLLNDTLPDITNCLSESRSVKRPLSAVREKPMVQQRGGKSADGQEMRQDKRRKLARFFAQDAQELLMLLSKHVSMWPRSLDPCKQSVVEAQRVLSKILVAEPFPSVSERSLSERSPIRLFGDRSEKQVLDKNRKLPPIAK